MKNFNIKQYVRNKLTKDNCDHLVLITKGYNEGLPVRIDYKCLLCNKKLAGKNQKVPTEDRYVYHYMPTSTKQGKENLKTTIQYLVNANKDKEAIDLVGMLREIDPLLVEYDNKGTCISESELNKLFPQPTKTYSKK